MTVLLVGIQVVGIASAANATRETGTYWSYIGASGSSQYMAWNATQERVRLKVIFAGNPNGSGTTCQDAAVDWDTNGSTPSHYDARAVRNCNPGHNEETDPGADGWWEEPSNYDEADVVGVQRVGSYTFPDNDLSNILSHSNLYGGGAGQRVSDLGFQSTDPNSVRRRLGLFVRSLPGPVPE